MRKRRAEPLTVNEREVSEHKGIAVGDRVELTRDWLREIKHAGISAEGLERRASPATVARIVVNDVAGWESYLLEHDSGHRGWTAADMLATVQDKAVAS